MKQPGPCPCSICAAPEPVYCDGEEAVPCEHCGDPCHPDDMSVTEADEQVCVGCWEGDEELRREAWLGRRSA